MINGKATGSDAVARTPVDDAVVTDPAAEAIGPGDSRVSVRRYVKAMFAATARSECLGLILVAARPDEADATGEDVPGIRGAVLGPYLGLARPVAAGEEGAGVVLPGGIRVLADGLDAHCWPGSEDAFRAELAEPSPESWDRGPRHRSRGRDAAKRAARQIAWYLGLGTRAMPAIAVLDPATRRGVVVSLPRGASLWGFGRRMVEELGGWPHRRLTVVTELLAERLERLATQGVHRPELGPIGAAFTAALDEDDEHVRATALARCSDALRAIEPATAASPFEFENNGAGSRAAVISELRNELDRCDQASSSANAAVRAARGEFGTLRTTTIAPPTALAGWSFQHLQRPGLLRRTIRRRD